MSALIDDVLRPAQTRGAVTPHSIVWMLVLLIAVVFWPTLSALGRIWLTVADYQHGFAIAVIAARWLFKARGRIDACDAKAEPRALAGLAVAVGLWMVAYRANSEMMQQLLLPGILMLTVLAALGPRVLKQVAAPFAYLYFAIPIWDHFIPLLQWLTTHVAEAVLGLLNVPTEVEGHNVAIPAGQFSIIDGCSGKRYFVIGLAFAVLAGTMQGVRGRRMIWLMIAAAATTLITNWLRVVIVIYAGHISNMQSYLVAVEHRSLGYVLYIPMLLAIILVARRLGGDEDISADPTRRARQDWRRLLVGTIAPVVLLIAPAVISATGPAADDSRIRLGALPLMTGSWQGPLPANTNWQPEFILPSEERRVSYAAADGRIELYVNSYGVQSPGRELVYHRNSVVPAAQWTVIRGLPRQDATPTMVIASEPASGRWVVGRMYVVGGRTTSVPALAQLYYGVSAVWRPAPSGIVAFATPCVPDCGAAAARLRDFWAERGRLLVDLIPPTL